MNPQAAPDIRDIKPWVALSEWGFWLAVALAVAAVLALAYWWWRRRKPKVKEVIVDQGPAGPTPEERLRALDAVALADDEAIRLFHFELSDSFRGALESQFGFPATDRTTEELRIALRGVVPDPGRVVSLLETADLVKFTDHRPAREECRELLSRALTVVEGWRPKPEETGAAPQFAGEANS